MQVLHALIRPYIVKLVAHNPGERSVGLPESWIDVKLSIGDEYFGDDPEFAADFVQDFKKFMKTWLDTRDVWTEDELKALERGEAEFEEETARQEAAYRKGR